MKFIQIVLLFVLVCSFESKSHKFSNKHHKIASSLIKRAQSGILKKSKLQHRTKRPSTPMSVQYAVLDADRQDEKWMEDDLIVDEYDVTIGGSKFDILKLIPITDIYLSTVEDLRKFFNENNDETSARFNPFENQIENLFENSPGSGAAVRVLCEGDITEIKSNPEYRFLLIEFESEQKANQFVTYMQQDLDALVKASPFKDFNFPQKDFFYNVKAHHHGVKKFVPEYLSLGVQAGAFLHNPSSPGTVSFGFQYHEIRDCKIDWQPVMPKSIESTPEHPDCCIVFQTNIFDKAYKYDTNYICSILGDEAKCIIEIKQIAKLLSQQCFATNPEADASVVDQGQEPAALQDDTINPPQTIEEKDAIVTEAENIADGDIDDPELQKEAAEIAEEEGYASPVDKAAQEDAIDENITDPAGACPEEPEEEDEESPCEIAKQKQEELKNGPKTEEEKQKDEEQKEKEEAEEEKKQEEEDKKQEEAVALLPTAEEVADAALEGCVQGTIKAFKEMECHKGETEEQMEQQAREECADKMKDQLAEAAKDPDAPAEPIEENEKVDVPKDATPEEAQELVEEAKEKEEEKEVEKEKQEAKKEEKCEEKAEEIQEEIEEQEEEELIEEEGIGAVACKDSREELEALKVKYLDGYADKNQEGEEKNEDENKIKEEDKKEDSRFHKHNKSKKSLKLKKKIASHVKLQKISHKLHKINSKLESLNYVITQRKHNKINKMRFAKKNHREDDSKKDESKKVEAGDDSKKDESKKVEAGDDKENEDKCEEAQNNQYKELSDAQIQEMRQELIQEEEELLQEEEEAKEESQENGEKSKDQDKELDDATKKEFDDAYNETLPKCDEEEDEEEKDEEKAEEDENSADKKKKSKQGNDGYCYKCHVVEEKIKSDAQIYDTAHPERPYDPELHKNEVWDPTEKKFINIEDIDSKYNVKKEVPVDEDGEVIEGAEVNEDGEVVDKNGKIIKGAEVNTVAAGGVKQVPVDEDGEVIEGAEVNEDGEVVDQNGKIIKDAVVTTVVVGEDGEEGEEDFQFPNEPAEDPGICFACENAKNELKQVEDQIEEEAAEEEEEKKNEEEEKVNACETAVEKAVQEKLEKEQQEEEKEQKLEALEAEKEQAVAETIVEVEEEEKVDQQQQVDQITDTAEDTIDEIEQQQQEEEEGPAEKELEQEELEAELAKALNEQNEDLNEDLNEDQSQDGKDEGDEGQDGEDGEDGENKDDGQCEKKPISIENLPDHETMVEMNREEGMYQSLRACPHLSEFSDEQLREIADDQIQKKGGSTSAKSDVDVEDSGFDVQGKIRKSKKSNKKAEEREFKKMVAQAKYEAELILRQMKKKKNSHFKMNELINEYVQQKNVVKKNGNLRKLRKLR